jgi:hypothetical protein
MAASRQAPTATVSGNVLDPSGALLPGATVVITNADTGQTRSTKTGIDGSFQLAALVPGRYELQISHDGLLTTVREFELTVDQTLILNLTLPLGRREQRVDVSPAAALIDPAKTSIGRTISRTEIDSLPAQAGRVIDYAALAALAPGILPAGSSTAPSASTAGQVAASNTFLVDGLSTDSPIAGGVGQLPIDAIDAFKVITNHATVEYGRASGAVIDIATRSGTNTRAGRLSWFQQSNDWSATSPAARLAGTKDPSFNQAIVTGFFSGPVVRDRAFFFTDAEYVDRHTAYIDTSPYVELFRPADPLTLPVDNNTLLTAFKSDVNLTPSNALTLRYSGGRDYNDNAQREDESTAERGRTSANTGFTGAVAETAIIGQRVINELNAQYRQTAGRMLTDAFCPGCPALNYPDIHLGSPANGSQSFATNIAEATDMVTLAFDGKTGRQTVKAGVDVMWAKYFGTFNLNTAGTYIFSPTDTPFAPSIPGSYPTSFQQNIGNPYASVQEAITSAFIEDQWQPRSTVTMNVGARWDHTSWPGPYPTRDDVGPRVGVAFDLSRKGTTVLRGAMGRYFDKLLLSTARDATLDFSQIVINSPAFQGYTNPARVSTVQYNTTEWTRLRTPYTDQASVGIEHQFAERVGVTADLVRALGQRLPIQMDLNLPDPTTGRRPNPVLNQVVATETIAASWYTGLQVGVRMRQLHQQSYSIAYTLSSSRNDTDGATSFPSNQRNILADVGPSPNDARHLVVATGTWTPGRWAVAFVTSAHTGSPYNITTGQDDNLDGTKLNDRPPNVTRNSARGAAFFDLDVRATRRLQIAGLATDVFVEAFNVTNHPNWTSYRGSSRNPARFGTPAAGGPPRQLQVGIRVSF